MSAITALEAMEQSRNEIRTTRVGHTIRVRCLASSPTVTPTRTASTSGPAASRSASSAIGAGRVVDLETERRRRGLRVTQSLGLSQPVSRCLEEAVRRHPAGNQIAARPVAVSAPMQPLVSVNSVAAHPIPHATSTVTVVPLVARAAGWVFVAVFVLGAALGLGLAVRPATYAGETWAHTVATGESLWALAEYVDSTRPLEDVVEDIRILNDLTDATLFPGQLIVLPTD